MQVVDVDLGVGVFGVFLACVIGAIALLDMLKYHALHQLTAYAKFEQCLRRRAHRRSTKAPSR